MRKFRVIPESELAEHHFEEFPVWSEHYDYEEIEDIERWGLDRDEVLKAFRENEKGNEHCVYTLLDANPFPPRMRIFIKASLESTDGRILKGYVMNEDAFCLFVFSRGETFAFSRHPMLEDLNREQEQKLLQSIGSPAPSLFPIKYSTEYTSKDGEAISGNFQYGKRET